MVETKTTRVVIATPNSGGPIVYSKLLATKLPSYSYEITVANFFSVEKFPKIIRHIIYFFKVWFQALGADIVYAQDPVSTGLPAFFAAKLSGTRFMQKIVGDYAWEQGSQRAGITEFLDTFSKKNKGYPFLVFVLKKIQTFVANNAEKIIVPSEYLKQIVKNWGVNEEKINVVYNAFNKPQLLDDKNTLIQKFGLSYPTIISVARLVPWKGLPYLIEAIKKVKETFPTVKLYIADDGPDRKYLEGKVKECNLEESVIFLGRIPQNQVFERIKAADLFVLISSYEGFSHLILETLVLGTPIVTTPVGGNVEIIKDGKNGIFVPFGDATRTADVIIELLKNRPLAEQLSNNGEKSLETFTEEQMVQKISGILR